MNNEKCSTEEDSFIAVFNIDIVEDTGFLRKQTKIF